MDRPRHRATVLSLLSEFPVVAILGPRQVGKTWLARACLEAWEGPRHWFDLESERDRARLEDPQGALEALSGLVVLDEIQLRPGLFSTLRALADRPRGARFLVVGSASPTLLKQGAESLAGRIAFHELEGFSAAEVGATEVDRLWLRGGFPRSFLAATDSASARWRTRFLRAFLERDLARLGVSTSAETMRRFWQMLAHLHGQTLNWSELGRAMGVSDKTVRSYLENLAATFMVRLLQPWHENISKRQVRSPKAYVADPGLLHSLLGLSTLEAVAGHPRAGASWEGFALTQVADVLAAQPDQCFFWATQAGAELDLLVVREGERRGFEFKNTTAPATTRSMHLAMESLGLDHLDVIHRGQESYPLGANIRALALKDLGRLTGP